jgi:mRNA interferase MazF
VGAPSIGEVVLVSFPFSELSTVKLRPAVCLADAGKGDWILCQITSNAYGDPNATPLDASDFATGGLLVASVARPGKLFTARQSLVNRTVSKLTDASLQRVLDAVIAVLRPPKSP